MQTVLRSTLTDRREQLIYDLAALQLWHAFHMATARHAPIARMILHQTRLDGCIIGCAQPVLPNLECVRQPAWREFMDHIEPVYAKHQPAGAIREFVDETMAYVFPLARQQDDAHEQECARRTMFDCFSYNYLPEAQSLALHFRNVHLPESPFADPPRLVRGLQTMLRHIDAAGIAARTIGCNSWINSLPPFQQIMPRSYVAHLRPWTSDDRTGWGWWGQFISHKGILHERRAQLLRTQQVFEYARLDGRCSLEDLRHHLAGR